MTRTPDVDIVTRIQTLPLAEAVTVLQEYGKKAHQAGIDEAVERIKKQRNTDSCIGISWLHHAEEKQVYNQALDYTIKALQDNK